jgi:anthranilate phosphoribosyltransferase
VLKGVEGSTQLSMSREIINVLFDGERIIDSTVQPADFGLQNFPLSRDTSISAHISFEEGVEALEDKEGFAKENIIYTAAVILTKFSLEPVEFVISKLRDSVSSGKALARWEKGCK